MEQLLLTPDGKKVKINTTSDIELYHAPRNPPNTGTAYTSGSDLYAHKAKSGNWHYYVLKWSMWQGSTELIHLITENEAKEYVIDKATIGNHWISGGVNEEEVTKLWGETFFEEDA